MPNYYLDSGVRHTQIIKAKTDREAWEELRKHFGAAHVYVFMYKYIDIPINNPKHFVKRYNGVYTDKLPLDAKTKKWLFL